MNVSYMSSILEVVISGIDLFHKRQICISKKMAAEEEEFGLILSNFLPLQFFFKVFRKLHRKYFESASAISDAILAFLR